ncbi:MAG: POTRA domain-containing protein [Bryobacteraceae bacterium]
MVHNVTVKGTLRPLEIETRAGEPLDPVRLSKDVRRIWSTGWFDDVRVENHPGEEGADLVFHVVEKPRYYLRDIKLEPPSHYKRQLTIKPGAAIDEAVAQELANSVRRTMVEDGHITAQIIPEIVPVGYRKADLVLHVELGDKYRVGKVEFSGDLGVPEKELRNALHATRIRPMIPKIWRSHPPLSDAAMDHDVQRLRAFYISKGYFDATVRRDEPDFKGDKATVRYHVDAGSRYGVAGMALTGPVYGEMPKPREDGRFPFREYCRCLLSARRGSEKEGRLEFDVRMEVEDSAAPASVSPEAVESGKWVNIETTVDPGPAYRVGRIEIEGNSKVGDLTVRRALTLDEGEALDSGQLRRSLVRLNSMNLFEPIEENHVAIIKSASANTADVKIRVKHRKGGMWALSGPVGPMSVAGPLQAFVATRLPPWGRGIFEASTYFLTFSVTGFANPMMRFLPFEPRRQFRPLIMLARPVLPGQRWTSGFMISPQLGWQGTAMTYGMTQAQQGVRSLIRAEIVAEPLLPVQVERVRPSGHGEPVKSGILMCQPPKPRLWWLRSAGSFAVNWFLGGRAF